MKGGFSFSLFLVDESDVLYKFPTAIRMPREVLYDVVIFAFLSGRFKHCFYGFLKRLKGIDFIHGIVQIMSKSRNSFYGAYYESRYFLTENNASVTNRVTGYHYFYIMHNVTKRKKKKSLCSSHENANYLHTCKFYHFEFVIDVILPSHDAQYAFIPDVLSQRVMNNNIFYSHLSIKHFMCDGFAFNGTIRFQWSKCISIPKKKSFFFYFPFLNKNECTE